MDPGGLREPAGRNSRVSPGLGFPHGSVVKNPPANAGDAEVGNGNLLQYSCLGNPMDRGAWEARVHGLAKSQT